VPGMLAKPIIDILIGVKNLGLDKSTIKALNHLRYEGLGEAGVPGRLYFRKRGEQAFNLAVVIWNGEQWSIILALLLNELKSPLFRHITQTITYMPHFITLVVVAGIIRYFTLSDGLINDVIAFFGGERAAFLQQSESFRPIYVISEIWQQVGWGTIIYLAAISGIDQQQYEAAKIDGATKIRQIWHITLPGILPTVMIMLILALGNLMNVGFEKIILLYSASIYETADVISTFVYRKGILEFNYGYSTAVGIFNSVINFIILLMANHLSKRVSQNSLW
jgi:putative aldouronate transport system permease protein